MENSKPSRLSLFASIQDFNKSKLNTVKIDEINDRSTPNVNLKNGDNSIKDTESTKSSNPLVESLKKAIIENEEKTSIIDDNSDSDINDDDHGNDWDEVNFYDAQSVISETTTTTTKSYNITDNNNSIAKSTISSSTKNSSIASREKTKEEIEDKKLSYQEAREELSNAIKKRGQAFYNSDSSGNSSDSS